MDAKEQKALADIERYGCHIIYVREEDALPPFAYSVGIQRSSDAPEVVVMGLAEEISCWLVNEYHRRVREEGPLELDRQYDGFLEGFPVLFRSVHRAHYREHFGWDSWYYGGDGFDVIQLIVPSTSGIWPWDPAAPEAFRQRQPLLQTTADYRPAAEQRNREAAAFTCSHIAKGTRPVKLVIRSDGDWAFYCGEGHGDDEPWAVAHRHHLIDADPTLREALTLAEGMYCERDSAGGDWKRGPLDELEEDD